MIRLSKSKGKSCVDCRHEGIQTKRKAPHPGPRCTTHHRVKRNERKSATHAVHVEATYNITIEQYWEIYEAQGGLCGICKRANGKRKKLSVDHDHDCCPGATSCGFCVRGLLCKSCNSGVLGHLRDSIAALLRAVEYLRNPPAQDVISRS